jgi:hypothetical protein
MSKNEDWQHVAKVIKYFLADVDHEMEVDSESAIPAVPPTTPASASSPFSVVEVRKLLSDNPLDKTLSTKGTTKGKTGEGSKKKRKRPAIDSDGEVCEEEIKK